MSPRPLFCANPRSKRNRFWASDEAHLPLTQMLGILSNVEDAYPPWTVCAVVRHKRRRYNEVIVDETTRSDVHLLRAAKPSMHTFRTRHLDDQRGFRTT